MSIVTFLEGSPCLALRTTSSFPCSPAPFTWQPTKACSDKTKAPGTGRSRRRLDGFSVAGPGHFYASGHPGDGVDLPAPVGLMETRDAGKTWSVRSLGGESDFHALTSSSKGMLGYGGVLTDVPHFSMSIWPPTLGFRCRCLLGCVGARGTAVGWG